MPKMLAQANRKLLWVPDNGILDVSSPTIAELTAPGVVDLSCLVTRANFTLGSTGDEAISDAALCADGNSSVPGFTNYESAMDFFRWTTDPEDQAWNLFTGKGIEGFLAQRIGNVRTYDEPITLGDELGIYGVITGTPQSLPVPDNGGYEKFRQTFSVQAELVDERAVVA